MAQHQAPKQDKDVLMKLDKKSSSALAALDGPRKKDGNLTKAELFKSKNLETLVHKITTKELGELLTSLSKHGDKASLIRTIEAICPYEKGNADPKKYRADAHRLGKAYSDAIDKVTAGKENKALTDKLMKPIYEAIDQVAHDHGGHRGPGLPSLDSEMTKGRGALAMSKKAKEVIDRYAPVGP